MKKSSASINSDIRIRVQLAAVLIFLFAVQMMYPQENNSKEKKRGDYLTIKIAVMGPGDELYFWWGHFGLIIEDSLSGISKFYDYGIFSFKKEHFFTNFAQGRLVYSSAVSLAQRNIGWYVHNNRDITLYTLDLDAEQKEQIQKTADFNALPENSDYLYNHFKDNCVTRILNMINDAVNGEFYDYAQSTEGRYTLRGHVKRHTYFSFFWDWLLNFVMGQDIDTKTTVMQEMFLPSEAGKQLANFYYTDTGGNKRNLVSKTEIINRSVNRPPVLDAPKSFLLRSLIFGILVAAILAFLRLISAKERNQNKLKKTARIIFAITNTVLGLFLGIIGTLTCYMSFFTNHDYSYHNMNVLLLNPILFIVFIFGIKSLFAKTEQKYLQACRIMQIVWTYIFCAGAAIMLLKLLPVFYQDNRTSLLIFMPISFVLSLLPNGFLYISKKTRGNK
ncbi:MAG: DUF4105 domain-containing protein [Termitinemataceae bacterium]|nr:MAG: DUF4105 domain-containing protein [Termitinemataceae bacterium]